MAGIGKYKGKGEFKMKGYSPYDGSSFKMKKYNSPAYQKQEDWEPAYPGADYSKEELEIMSADERATAEGQAKLKEMRQDPTFEGTDEYRKVEDIPAHEYEHRGLKKPKQKPLSDYRKDQPKHYHTRTEERAHPDDKKKKKSTLRKKK